MCIVNRFHLGTDSKSNDSLESLTKSFYDYAIDSPRAVDQSCGLILLI